MAVLVFVLLEEWQTNRKITTHLANDKSYENLSQAPWATLLPSVGIQTLACRPVDVTSVGVQTLVLYMNPVPVFPGMGLP